MFETGVVKNHFTREFARLANHFDSSGIPVRIDVSWSTVRSEFVVVVRLHDFENYYYLSEDEMYMDGGLALDHLLTVVKRDIRDYWYARCRTENIRMVNDALLRIAAPPVISGPQMTATEVQARRTESFRSFAIDSPVLDTEYLRQFQVELARLIDQDGLLKPQYTTEADAKAKELFKTVAGKQAFDTLDVGKPLPLKGSKGTEYTLHKRATFCVERPSDGARLCAVVPGVPLWDHLLGIKLMIENDEPKFLATANVSGAVDMRPGAINYMSSEFLRREFYW